MPSSKSSSDSESSSSSKSASDTEPVLKNEEAVPLESSASVAHINVELVGSTPVKIEEDEESSSSFDSAADKLKPKDEESSGLGSEFEGLTVYEKKSLLINQKLDQMGMGKYQWCLYFLCGGGYLLDLMWAMIIGLVAPSITQELGVPDEHYADIFVAFSAGLTVGAFFWGLAVDIIGRSWAFNITIIISSVFGTLIGAPSNWGLICFFNALLGTGIGGNIPIDSTILLEFLPQNRRFLLASLSVFQPIGVLTAAIFAYLLVPGYSCDVHAWSCHKGPFRDFEEPEDSGIFYKIPCCSASSNMGWRYAIFLVGGVTIALFVCRFFIFRFIESPKFLLSKGRDQEAIDSVLAVAKFNKHECKLTMEDFKQCEIGAVPETVTPFLYTFSENKVKYVLERVKHAIVKSNVKGLFANKTMIRLTVLTWITYGFDAWGFSVAGAFLPLLLRRNNVKLDLSLNRLFRNNMIIYSCGIPGVMLAIPLIEAPRIGRKWGMVISSAAMAVSLFLFSVVETEAAMVGFNALEYFAQSLFNAILYGWTPEAFPSPFRGSACGLASTVGRFMSIIGPIIASKLLSEGNPAGVLYLAGAGVFICTICTALLPFDTKGKQSF